MKEPEGIQEIPWQQTSSRLPGGYTIAARIAYRSPATIVRKTKIQNGLTVTVFFIIGAIQVQRNTLRTLNLL